MKGYTVKETARLLTMAQDAEVSGKSLTAVFKAFAAETGRAKVSVRNYYYQLIKNSANAPELKEKFPALEKMRVSKNIGFTEKEEKDLIEWVEDGIRQGKSVRRTISELAGGDQKLALRYQNKYRNIKKSKDKTLFENKDYAYKELSDKINALFDRIGRNLKSENEKLKEKVKELTEENKRLKRRATKSVISEYFLTRESDIDNKLKR